MNTKSFLEEIIIAGFGGQGILLCGKLLAQTVMKVGHHVTYMPSYGAEVRGGTANCMIVMGTEPVACPIVHQPNTLIAMNQASLNKFCPRLKKGGLLVMNSSLIDVAPPRSDIDVVALPAEDIAVEVGSPKSANMVALGCYLEKRGLVNVEDAVRCLGDVLARRYHDSIPVTPAALRRGA
jgi:2-oxoglutarate ferredoxin oxidoreductase subunit gamma